MSETPSEAPIEAQNADQPEAKGGRKPSPVAAFEHLLGKMSDRDVAEKAGTSPSAVAQYRRYRKIAPFGASEGTASSSRAKRSRKGRGRRPNRGGGANAASDLTASVAALLGDEGRKSTDIADELGAPPLEVRDALLKLESQGRARRTGQTRGTRWHSTESTGSEPLPPEAGEEAPAPRARPSRTRARGRAAAAAAPKGKRVYTSKLDEHRDIVGVLSDAEVAARVGMSTEGVRRFRRVHNIPSASSRGEGAAKAPASARAPKAERPQQAEAPKAAAPRARKAAGGSAFAWKAVIRIKGAEQERYLVAGSLADAAAVAGGAADDLGGEVLTLARVGVALS